jgi:hypothetical protein
MGCHTWFYNKVNRPIEEARRLAIEEIEKDRKSWQEIVDNDYSGVGLEDWRQWEKDGPGEGHIENWIKVLERQKRMVEKGFCNAAVYNRQPGITRVIDDELYQEVEGSYHDVFRRSYTDDVIKSFDEAIEYLEENDDKIRYAKTIFDKTPREESKAEAIERLKKFWEEYPEGIIIFG